MEKADKVWVAVALVVPLYFRGRNHRRKIKDLKKLVEILNLENEFLHTFVAGLTDPSVDKKTLLESLAAQFQFISMVKEI